MNHKDLDVWKKAIELVEVVYQFTKKLPESEKFGLFSQLRRASVSVPSNISEGAARKSDKEFVQFCYIALGSLAEVETQLILCQKLFNLKSEAELLKVEECMKLLLGFIRYLKNKR